MMTEVRANIEERAVAPEAGGSLTKDWELQKWWLTSNIKVHDLQKCKESYFALCLATPFDAGCGWDLDVFLLDFPCHFFHLVAGAGARGLVALLIPLKEAIFVPGVLLMTTWLLQGVTPGVFCVLGSFVGCAEEPAGVCRVSAQRSTPGSWEGPVSSCDYKRVIPGCVLAFLCCMWSVWHPNADKIHKTAKFGH